MELQDTVKWMNSEDYKERFKAEYHQLKIRHDGLKYMLHKWDKGELEIEPKSPKNVYSQQLASMTNYLSVLEYRAYLEKIKLN